MRLALVYAILFFVERGDSAITYQLYTKMNMKMGQPLVYKNSNTIHQSNYNSAKKNKLGI